MSYSTIEEQQVLVHLFELCRRPNPSGFEEVIRTYVRDTLTACQFTVAVDPFGNLTAQRGALAPGEGYPLLSFHLDSASQCVPGDLWDVQAFSETRYADTLRFWQLPQFREDIASSRGAYGLGGDDKCGAAIALALAEFTAAPLKIVASVQAEQGCRGITCVSPSFFADVAYALVLDHPGSGDLVTRIGRRALCQRRFAQGLLEAATLIGQKARPVEGTLSDAYHLSAWLENVVNLSVGYVHAGSADERIVLADVLHTYHWVQSALRLLPRPLPPQQEDRLLES
jgi:putative aminopeptidase FrvX